MCISLPVLKIPKNQNKIENKLVFFLNKYFNSMFLFKIAESLLQGSHRYIRCAIRRCVIVSSLCPNFRMDTVFFLAWIRGQHKICIAKYTLLWTFSKFAAGFSITINRSLSFYFQELLKFGLPCTSIMVQYSIIFLNSNNVPNNGISKTHL